MRFVPHDHRKLQPHFDLRLEEGGVLRSWAEPRGLPDDPADNRLAIAVPDHVTYEDADKFIADSGPWEEHDRTDKRLDLPRPTRVTGSARPLHCSPCTVARAGAAVRTHPYRSGLAAAFDQGATRA